MPSLRVAVPHDLLDTGVLDLAALRDELGVRIEFGADALAEAEAAAHAPRLPDVDRTDLPLLTIDPAGSLDLDQALHLEHVGNGYRVWYAIADPAAFVTPGGALDAELRERGVTLYAPDLRVPLHPPVLAEDAASLLPDVVRPAVLWQLDLDADGELTATQVQRARVRSRRRLDYEQVQAALAGGSADEVLQLLRTVGELRQARGRDRGAVDVPTPEQEVVVDAAGRPSISLRAQLPSEGWNAQLSLLTGMAAAQLMLEGGVGLLRTLPPPDPETVDELRRSAVALGVGWPVERSRSGPRPDDGLPTPYGDVVSALDPAVPAHAALLTLATRLLRGAGYTAFDGAPPEQPLHSAVAAPYAHCTAPLRRLADRYVSEVCVALSASEPVPGWAREALPELPGVMAGATHRASELERAVVDAAEAVVLAPHIGEVFDAVVVASRDGRGTVQLTRPAVRASCTGNLPLGEAVRVRLDVADPAGRQVRFSLLSGG